MSLRRIFQKRPRLEDPMSLRRIFQKRPRLEAPEMFGQRALARIARALPPVERAYANIRFAIMRPKLLSVMDLLLPSEGRILDVGCGFGLFAAYFGQTQPDRAILGVDPDGKRVVTATNVAKKLGLTQHTFLAADANDPRVEGPFDAVYCLDVMHHVPEDQQVALLAHIKSLLAPGGIFVMKDITTDPPAQLLFTEFLDRVMVGWNEPLCYRHHREWGEILTGLGFKVRMVRVPDLLPYPHVVIAATLPH